MKSNFLRIILILCMPVWAAAQNHSSWFTPVSLLGEEFTQRKELSVHTDLEKRDKKSIEQQKNFKDANEFHIDRFLNCGMVISSSAANNYLNQVADKLLVSYPELRREVKFYFVYTSEVNAFTFTNGMIFINIGLMAHLENEAQLAFVLSHEIAHYVKKHAFERFKFQENKSENLDEEEFLEIVLSKFSRDQEFDADAYGLEYYLTSGYDPMEAVKVFEILKNAEFPIENKSIPRSVFEGKYLKIPVGFYSDSAVVLSDLPADDIDTSSTHPSSARRQEIMLAKIKNAGSASSRFLVSQKQFEELRLACQFELSSIFIHERNNISSLYNTEVLLSHYPNNEYLKEYKVKALYYLIANINSGAGSSVVRMPKKVKGEIRKFHQLFKSASWEEMNAIALRQAWDIRKSFPDNKEIELFSTAITRLFQYKVSHDLSFFEPLSKYDEIAIQSNYQVDSLETKQKRYSGNSMKRVRKTRKVSFAKFAMPDYLDDKEFVKVFQESAAEVSKNKDENVVEIEQYDLDDQGETRKKEPAAKVKKEKKKVNSSINNENFTSKKILFIDISSLKVDTRSKEPVQYRDSRAKQDELVYILETCAKLNQVDIEIFNPKDLKPEDSLLFQDRTLLQRWRNERLANTTVSEMLPSDHAAIQKLCERYQTHHVAFIQTASVLIPQNNAILVGNLLYTIIHPPLFCIAMYSLFTTHKRSFIRIPVYDIRSGENVYSFHTEYGIGDKKDIYNAEFYYFFHSIKP